MSTLVNIGLKELGISRKNGFLPDCTPLRRLPGTYYNPWELIVSHLPKLLNDGGLRTEIEKLPILLASHLKSEREWQRGYSVLGFLTHAYIWGGALPKERLPTSISIPFLEVAAHLDLPPTATYAGLSLWNFAPSSPEADLTDPDNLESLITFTGTPDEAWFYLISVAMEARGGAVIHQILALLDAVAANDADTVTDHLLALADCLAALGTLLERMHEKCDPHLFCHRIRPFLAGSKNMACAGLPNGVFYDEGDGGRGRFHQYCGGSNAQSSLLQFFDVVLGVEHRAPATKEEQGEKPFLLQMRRYMPGPHRRFLALAAAQQQQPPTAVRPFVHALCAEHPAVVAYNETVAAFASFRDKHLRLVARYIVAPSRNPKPPVSLNLASATTLSFAPQGTGGTALLPFLKQTRDETMMMARV